MFYKLQEQFGRSKLVRHFFVKKLDVVINFADVRAFFAFWFEGFHRILSCGV